MEKASVAGEQVSPKPPPIGFAPPMPSPCHIFCEGQPRLLRSVSQQERASVGAVSACGSHSGSQWRFRPHNEIRKGTGGQRMFVVHLNGRRFGFRTKDYACDTAKPPE